MAPSSRSGGGFGADASGTVWEVGLVAMPAFVAQEDGRTVHPLVALVMEAAGAIRSSALGPADQPLEVLESAIANALRDPEAPCRPGAPRRVVVNRADLLELLPPLLQQAAISVGATPQLDRAVKLMRQELAGGEELLGTQAPSTYLSGDIGPEAVARFFEAAAALYQRRPWERIPGDGYLFQLSCSALAIQRWVGCVIGQQREHYGVILFQSFHDYERYVELGERFEAGDRDAMDEAPSHRAINFEAKSAMPASFLQEIKRYGWPVAPGDAYPTVMLIEPPQVLKPPRRADLLQLEAVALALVAWIEAEPQIDRLWQQPSPKRRRFPVEVGGERVSVTIGALVRDERPAPPGPTPAAPPRQPSGLKVPAALRETVDRLLAQIDPFCASHLDDDYRPLIHEAVAALARKRPSPLLTGRDASWCAGVVHAIGAANFLFDSSQSPHCSAGTIADHFGVATSTSHNHAKKVRDLLKITPFSPRWCLHSLLESSEILWILEVDGFLLDIRTLPIEIQLEAADKGLIPYVPALRGQRRGGA